MLPDFTSRQAWPVHRSTLVAVYVFVWSFMVATRGRSCFWLLTFQFLPCFLHPSSPLSSPFRFLSRIQPYVHDAEGLFDWYSYSRFPCGAITVHGGETEWRSQLTRHLVRSSSGRLGLTAPRTISSRNMEYARGGPVSFGIAVILCTLLNHRSSTAAAVGVRFL